MLSRKPLALSIMLFLFLLATTACIISAPGGSPSADEIATSVAATVNAKPGVATDPAVIETPGITLPPATTELPTLPPPPTIYPLSVAFVSPDRNAYYWNETMAAPIALTISGDIESAIVSPDGMRIALTRTTDWVAYSLEVINSDGSGLRTILNPAGFAALPRPAESMASAPNQLNWVPGTNKLAMTTRLLFEGPGYQTGDRLYLLDSDTSTIAELLTFSTTWSWHYSYSPDGSKIAISYPDGMDIYSNTGTLIKKPVLVYPFIQTASEYAWVATPTWSADSSQLVAVVPPEMPFADPVLNSSVYRLSADGLIGELMFSAPMSYSFEVASVSPDLSKVAFLTPIGLPTDNQSKLRLASIDGISISDYATGTIYNLPIWSTDSSKFYYRIEESGAWVGQSGTAPIILPDFRYARNVVWVDVNRFIGASGPEGGWKLLLGTIGAPTGLIYSAPAAGERLNFSVNR